MHPVPTPMSSPQSSHSCQGEVITVVAALAAATTSRARVTVRRTPQRSITAAANGAMQP